MRNDADGGDVVRYGVDSGNYWLPRLIELVSYLTAQVRLPGDTSDVSFGRYSGESVRLPERIFRLYLW